MAPEVSYLTNGGLRTLRSEPANLHSLHRRRATPKPVFDRQRNRVLANGTVLDRCVWTNGVRGSVAEIPDPSRDRPAVCRATCSPRAAATVALAAHAKAGHRSGRRGCG